MTCWPNLVSRVPVLVQDGNLFSICKKCLVLRVYAAHTRRPSERGAYIYVPLSGWPARNLIRLKYFLIKSRCFLLLWEFCKHPSQITYKVLFILLIIVHSTKLLNFDWSRVVQLIPNCTPTIKFPWQWRNFVECSVNKKSHDLLVQFMNNRYSWFWKFSNCTGLKAREILRTFKITRTY